MCLLGSTTVILIRPHHCGPQCQNTQIQLLYSFTCSPGICFQCQWSLRSVQQLLHNSSFYPKPRKSYALIYTMLFNYWPDTAKSAPSCGGINIPMQCMFYGPTRLRIIPNCISIGSAVFAQLTAESSYVPILIYLQCALKRDYRLGQDAIKNILNN